MCFDIDGTICTNTMGDYPNASPLQGRIAHINSLFEQGNKIIYFTARGSKTDIDWSDFTRRQLEAWGAKYHELYFGKPEFDIIIDDKAFNSEEFFDAINPKLGSKCCVHAESDDCKCWCHVQGE